MGIAPIDPTSLPGPAQKILAPGANPKLKQMACRGIVPGLRPDALLSVMLLLGSDPDPAIAEQARSGIAKLPDPILNGALQLDLPPAVIDALCDHYLDRFDIVERLVAMAHIDPETVEMMATRGNEAVTELVATNQERLLANPPIIAALYMNRNTRMSTADRIVELAARNNVEVKGIPAWKEAAIAIEGELIPEPSDEPLPDDELFFEVDSMAEDLADASLEDAYFEDETGDEQLEDNFKPLHQRLAEMSVSQKIRRAQLGSKEERMMLVRESNKIVASAAARSPLMREPDIVSITRSRGVCEDVLRIIGMTPEWMKSYQVKKNLVENTKTPFMIAQRLVTQLRESDLRKLAKSKNVSAAIQMHARRHLSRKKK